MPGDLPISIDVYHVDEPLCKFLGTHISPLRIPSPFQDVSEEKN